MSTSSIKSKKGLYVTLIVGLWMIVALGAVYYVKPDFWKDTHDYYIQAQQLAGKGQLSQARSTLQKALDAAPDNPGYLIYYGALSEQAGDLEAAASSYHKALALQPGNAEAALGLGKVLLDLGREQEAVQALLSLNLADLETPLLERRAGLLASKNQHEQAIRDFRELLKREPGNPAFARGLAASFMARESWAQAESALSNLLGMEIDPQLAAWGREQLAIALRAQKKLEQTYALLQKHPNAENLRLRAELALEMERFDEAASLFRQLAANFPDDAEVKNKLAVSLRAAGKLDEAYAVFGLSPEDEHLAEKAQLAMQLQKFDDAARMYAQLMAIGALLPEHRKNLIIALRELGRLQEAYSLLLETPAPENLEERAQLAMQLQKFDHAVRFYKELLQTNPPPAKSEAYKNQLAIALRAQNQLEEAYAAFSAAPSENNLDERAQLALQLDKYEDAARLYAELQQLRPNDAETLRQLAVAQRAAGALEEAYATLKRIPGSENLATRAQLALQLERFQEAAQLYRELTQKEPENTEAKQGLAIALRSVQRLEEAYKLFTEAPSGENLLPRAELALQLEKYDDAAALFQELSKERPEDAKIKEQLAYALDKAGQQPETAAIPPDAAAAEYRKLVESDQASPDTRIRYAWLLMRQGDYDTAYRVISPLPPDTLEILKLQAESAFLSGKMDAAAPLLEELARREPDDAHVWNMLADARDAMRLPGKAAAAMRRVTELSPGDLKAKARLAELLERSGNTREAEKIYLALLDKDPENVKALAAMATLYESRGNYGQALAMLLRLQKRDPSMEHVGRIARLYVWQKALPAARQWYERFLAMGPSAAQRAAALTDLAGAHVNGGEPERALEYLHALNAAQSRSPQLLELLARAAMQTGRPDLAVKALEKLSTVRSLSPVELVWLGGQYRLLGENGKALALYEQANAANPLRSPADLEALGDLRMDAGAPAKALQAYEAIAQNARTSRVHLKIARAADKAGRKQLALEAYEQVLAAGDQDASLNLEIARFMVNVGRYDKALRLYDQVVASRGPAGLELELALANLAAQRFAPAESWAEKAIASGGGWKAQLALVQALHLQGKSASADKVLGEHEAEIMAHREGREWMGYVAVARDRQLQAFTIFDDLIKEGRGDIGKFWLWRGIAATRRGDFSRARESFDKAKSLGTSVPSSTVRN